MAGKTRASLPDKGFTPLATGVTSIFYDNENPVDVLDNISSLLCFLKEMDCYRTGTRIELSPKASDGFCCFLGFLETTVTQVSEAINPLDR